MRTDVKRVWLLLPLLLVFMLPGCDQDDSTGLSSRASLTARALGTEVELIDLATDPIAYEDQWILARGQYGLLPIPPCDAAVHLPPATWSLIANGVVVRMAGMENVLRPLVLDGQVVVAEGYWRRWDGPVGCGAAAFPSTVWYLQVKRILDPNPLVRATSTPGGAAAIDASSSSGLPTATPTPTAPFSPLGTPTGPYSPLGTPTGPYSPLGTPTDPYSPLGTPTGPYSPLPTLSPPPSPTLISWQDLWPTFTPLPEVTEVDSPIATPDTTTSGTTVPTATSSPTLSPTSAPALLEMGQVSIDQVVNGWLAIDQTHSWTYDATAGDVITVTVGPAGGIDLKLVVYNPSGAKVAERDYTPAGGEETIAALELDYTGQYELLVSEVHGYTGDYAIVVLNGDSVAISFPGSLIYGATRTTTLPAQTYQIWHFMGSAFDLALIRFSPADDSDLVFSLYGPDMDLIRRVNHGGSGFVEQLTIQLPATGFYSIWLEEDAGEEAAYTLWLTDVD